MGEYQNIARKPLTRYNRDVAPISIGDARAEPPEQQLFEAEAPAPKPQFTLSTQFEHRGRVITVTATNMNADQFCDLLDSRGFAPPHVTQSPAAAPTAAPICPVHQGRAMKLMQRPDKQGRTHMCTAKVGDGWCDQRA